MKELNVICDVCKRKMGKCKTTYPFRLEMDIWNTQFKHTCLDCNEVLKNAKM